MISFLELLRKRNEACNNSLSEADIKEFINTFEVNSFKESSAIIFNGIPTAPGSYSFNWHRVGNWTDGVSYNLNDIFATGSGTESFLEFENQPSAYSSDGDGGLFDRVTHNITTSAHLLLREALTKEPLYDLFGSGYEMIIFQDGAYQKKGELAYILSMSPFRSPLENIISKPFMVIYQKYYRDFLVITSIPVFDPVTNLDNETYEIVCKEHMLKYFIVPPLDKNQIDFDRSQVLKSFRTNEIAIAYLLIRDDNNHFNPALYSKKKDLELEFEYGEHVKITMRKSFIDDSIRANETGRADISVTYR